MASDGNIIWYWFFTLLSAASQSLQERLRIDPCTPTGYSYSAESLKLPPSSESEKVRSLFTVQTMGNFSECRSAALMLLQKGKGHIFNNFLLLRFPLKWSFLHCCFVLKLVILLFMQNHAPINTVTWDQRSYQIFRGIFWPQKISITHQRFFLYLYASFTVVQYNCAKCYCLKAMH